MKPWIAAGVVILCLSATTARAENGTLVIDVGPFTSEVELKDKIQKQLESGGIEWGQTGNRIVFTTVNKRFLNFDIAQFTRYGTQKSLDLPEGDYVLTCVGLVPHTAFSPEKILSKGGYFNEGILTVHVKSGATATLKIRPVIRKQSTLFLKLYMPELMTTVEQDGGTSAEISLNAESEKSVKWDDYAGDLKFKAGAAAK
ncbi:MAG: hypothetical protein RL684_3194 [Pseudomonadota bacterium]